MKYNVSEIIDFEIISIFQKFSLITFILTVILEIFYGIIVYLTTTKTMQFFRILTFIYIFECILAEFLMLCWKPFRLFPYTVFYPTRILAPMSSTLSALLTAFYFIVHGCFVETLAIIIVERHFRILGSETKIQKTRFWVYFILAATFLSTIVTTFVFIFQNLDDAKVTNLLKSKVSSVEEILDLQPSLFSISHDLNITLWILFANAIIYANVRIFITGFVLKENYKFVKKSNNQHISERTRKQFTLMFQSTMIQFLTSLFFSGFAGIWILSFFIGENNRGIKMAFFLSVGFMMCYPIADVLIVITVVKGYRNTLKKIINIFIGKKNRRISGFGFQNISGNNYNKNKHTINIHTTAAKRKLSMY